MRVHGTAWALLTCAWLVGCATEAPPLPTTIRPNAAAARHDPAACDAVRQELRAITEEMQQNHARIATNRGQNQAVGYVAAVLFPPLAFAAEANPAERARVTELYARRDAVLDRAAAARCTLED